jgi:hypothetical protein
MLLVWGQGVFAASDLSHPQFQAGTHEQYGHAPLDRGNHKAEQVLIGLMSSSKDDEGYSGNETLEDKILSVTTKNYSYNSIMMHLGAGPRSFDAGSAGKLFKPNSGNVIDVGIDIQIMDFPVAVGVNYNYLMTGGAETHFGKVDRSGDEIGAGLIAWVPTGLTKMFFFEPFIEFRSIVSGSSKLDVGENEISPIKLTAAGSTFALGGNFIVNRHLSFPILYRFGDYTYKPKDADDILSYDQVHHGSDLAGNSLEVKAKGNTLLLSVRYRT